MVGVCFFGFKSKRQELAEYEGALTDEHVKYSQHFIDRLYSLSAAHVVNILMLSSKVFSFHPASPFLTPPRFMKTVLKFILAWSMLSELVAFAATPSLVPLPQEMQVRPGVFTLCPTQLPSAGLGHPLVEILTDPASLGTGQYFAAQLFKSTGEQFIVKTTTYGGPTRNAVLLTTAEANTNLGAEGYELTVAPDSVVIRAPATAGVFYGVQSLLQLLPPQVAAPLTASNTLWTIPCVYIYDQPRFPWRGVMLDVARHFVGKEQIKQLLDTMAALKLNTFHWHLTDDQGWRLEITNYPALTTNSAWRAGIDYGLNPRASSATNAAGQYGGFYTQDDAREIVAYAQQLHITVVPEIEMPCHATAGLAAYPQFGCGNPQADYQMDYPNINYGVDLYSPGSPGTLAFLEEILSEVMAIFPGQYIHCGGDEVVSSDDTQWNSYSYDESEMQALGIKPGGTTSIVEYQHWFSTNIATFVESKGRTMMGWTETENGGILPNAALMDWETGSSSEAIATAEAGQKVVMAPDSSCYINYIESTNLNLEPPFIVGSSPAYLSVANVYSFEPLPSDLPSQYDTNILGAQCELWTEYVPSFENVLFKMFPRECAMAELTWTPAASKNFTSFTNRLVSLEQRLGEMGVNYDHENIPQIGSWTPAQVSPQYSTWQWDITTNVSAAGEIDVSYAYTSGTNGLHIAWTSLLENGTEIDRDTHDGYALNLTPAAATTNGTLFILHLPVRKPGATYLINASVQGSGGTNSFGNVYLPNWD
jgi:hexosaminidase